MKVYIQNLYGMNDGNKAYYRKQGVHCFDFVNDKKYASNLSEDETKEILRYKSYYTKMYGALKMGIED